MTELDDSRIRWLEPVWRMLGRVGCTDQVWSFAYPEYLQAFKKAVVAMGCPDVGPYQMRHSGPSTDLAARRRTPLEAQRRPQDDNNALAPKVSAQTFGTRSIAIFQWQRKKLEC